ERQRGRGAAEIELGEDRQKIEREPGVEEPALHRVLHAAARHDPPAVENPPRALGERAPHRRRLASGAAARGLTVCSSRSWVEAFEEDPGTRTRPGGAVRGACPAA